MDDRKIKDSGKKREFVTGAHRDASDGKGRCDLLPMREVLMAYGAIKDMSFNTSRRDILKTAVECISSGLDTCVGPNPHKADFIEKMAYVAGASAICSGWEENDATGDIDKPDVNAHDDIEEGCMVEPYFWYGMLQVSKHYEEGAKKYGDNNWKKGMPLHVYVDSCLRHLMKALAGMNDEPHIRAASWNALCFIWTASHDISMDDMFCEEKKVPE